MKRDPKPWEEMTPAEKKAHSQLLREQMKAAPRHPDDDSPEILAEILGANDRAKKGMDAPLVSEMLTPSELERLRRGKKLSAAYFRDAFRRKP